MNRDDLVVLVDSREQSPWSFRDVETRVCALHAGDYAPLGCEDRVAIERKSLTDFTSTLTHGRERFEDELRRLAAYARALIVVEASLEEIQLGAYRSKATPASLVGSVASIHARWGVPTLFFRNRMRAQEFARVWLAKMAKHIGSEAA